MNNEELIACIRAEMDGKKIEYRFLSGELGIWRQKGHDGWSTTGYEYRILKEPRARWGVMDRDGDTSEDYEGRADAEEAVARLNRCGPHSPYTLCRIEEVL